MIAREAAPLLALPPPVAFEDSLIGHALYAAAARLDRSIAALTAARKHMHGTLPLCAAEKEMHDTEDHLDALDGKLKRALALVEAEIERGEAV